MTASAVQPRRSESEPIVGPASDALLVEGVRRGEVAAFERLYRRYWTRLYQFCFRYVRSADEAADVVQDVFFRVWRGRADWRVSGPLDRYLHLAVRNGAFDRLEHAAVVQRWRRDKPELDGLPQPPAAADDILEAAEVAAVVDRALGEMPAKRRAICVLRWADGLSYAEIADRLGVAQKTVENQIGRGLRLLRARISPPDA